MIKTVTTIAGDGEYARIAQEHAITLAKALGSELRVVAAWDPSDAPDSAEPGEHPGTLAQQELNRITDRAELQGLTVSGRLTGEGVRRGVLDASEVSDLLVVAIPTEQDTDDPLTRATLDRELPFLRGAACSVLAVSQPPSEITKILVDYQGGAIGRTALNVVGELASGLGADVAVMAVKGDVAEAARLATAGEAYLQPFHLNHIDRVEKTGVPDSRGDILSFAESEGADMIVIGEEPVGLLDRLLGQDTADQVALATNLPVLIAR
jgi:nucleotide-binding universal stress UspA family protein